MLELNKKVFGNIMTQEIIGSAPSITEIKIIFEKELVNLLDKLKLISKENIENILAVSYTHLTLPTILLV